MESKHPTVSRIIKFLPAVLLSISLGITFLNVNAYGKIRNMKISLDEERKAFKAVVDQLPEIQERLEAYMKKLDVIEKRLNENP